MLTGGVAIPEYPGDHFHYVFSKILMAGRANGLQVIDGPFLKVRELDGLREFSHADPGPRLRRQVGPHPDQVGVLNEVYSPTQEQFDRAWEILDAYRKATEDDRNGAVMFGDEMIDEASRKMATKFVSRGERAGLTRSSSAADGHRDGNQPSGEHPDPDNSELEFAVPLLEDGVVAVGVERAQRRPVVQGELQIGGGPGDGQVTRRRLRPGPVPLDIDPVRLEDHPPGRGGVGASQGERSGPSPSPVRSRSVTSDAEDLVDAVHGQSAGDGLDRPRVADWASYRCTASSCAHRRATNPAVWSATNQVHTSVRGGVARELADQMGVEIG